LGRKNIIAIQSDIHKAAISESEGLLFGTFDLNLV
jgi:hypothetical protein